ncbi:MAG: helix-turn-helix domain-containing protein [Candidatus Marinimicrobia bacterium]|nr:helix-turn-helix domain-containing protein [Candidatus Neomarinimicrobiota bacterium]
MQYNEAIQLQLNRITRLLESKLLPEYLTIKESSQLLKCSQSTIRKMLKNGDIPFSRLNSSIKSSVLIKRSELLKVVK